MYGFCILRFLYHVHSLRSTHPHKTIIISKIDVKSAYRRANVAPALAEMSIHKVDEVALMILPLEFGGATRHFDWSGIVTDPVTDLGNDSLNSDCAETEF